MALPISSYAPLLPSPISVDSGFLSAKKWGDARREKATADRESELARRVDELARRTWRADVSSVVASGAGGGGPAAWRERHGRIVHGNVL